MIRVRVSDDGKGLPDALKPSYGIAGMSERVRATGGEIRLTNRPGGGVTLEAWIPVSAPHVQAEASAQQSTSQG